MVSLGALWLPILLSAVAVFIVSSIIHMLLKYHNSDFGPVPAEEGVMEALRAFNIPPGDYFMPRCADMKEMGSEAYIAKQKAGPNIIMTVVPNEPTNMGPQLIQWFVFSVFVGVLVAYITGLTIPAGAEYLLVSRVAGAVAFCCHAVGNLPNSIWYKRGWGSTLKNVLDGLAYALVTGGVFGWLWPGA
jgi:hypothetical protein